jgi:hypothetical protein
MIEREMDNCGSKRVLTVKEQRVDGSWYKKIYFVFKVYSNGFWKKLSMQNPFISNKKYITIIRCNLPLINKLKLVNNNLLINKSRNYTTISKMSTISGDWIAGFVDAEGCFRISITKNKNYKGNPWLPSLYDLSQKTKSIKTIPLSVRLYFQIGLHIKDKEILKLIQLKLGVGKIYSSRLDSVELIVSSFKDMEAVIKFFDKYSLITQKLVDYNLFKKAYKLIKNKEHLNIEGLVKLVELKSLNNNGLSGQLKEAFPNLDNNKSQRQEINKDITNPNWISGFTSGEGCFKVRIYKSVSHQIGYQVQLKFQVTQQLRDKNLMAKLISYLDCGYLSERGDIVDFHVTKFNDIIQKIIPFFEKYSIIGVKLDNFKDFCQVAELIKNNEHREKEGSEKIRLIQLKMNSLRDK